MKKELATVGLSLLLGAGGGIAGGALLAKAGPAGHNGRPGLSITGPVGPRGAAGAQGFAGANFSAYDSVCNTGSTLVDAAGVVTEYYYPCTQYITPAGG